jgi:hypothetical protein
MHVGYEAVSALSEQQQRALLQRGDAQERVWAAWSLGLRLGSASTGLLLEGLRREPPAGTRMHFAALLAGAGEVGAVAALATGDPSAEVRATACQYLIKTSATPDPWLASLLDDRLRVDGSEVRQRILVESPGRIGPVAPETLAVCAADTDRRVRDLALAELAQVPPATAARLLEDRLLGEDDPELRPRVVEVMLAAERAGAVLDAAGRAAPEQARELLASLAERGRRFAWSVLSPLAARRIPLVDGGVLRLVDDLADASAVRWQISGIVRALRLPPARCREDVREQAAARHFADDAMKLLRAGLGVWPLRDADQGDLRTILEFFEGDLRYLLDYELEDDDDFDIEAEVRELRRQCNALRERLGMAALESE